MGETWTYEDMLRVHDLAMYQWLGGLLVDYGNLPNNTVTLNEFPILRVYASPERAWAKMNDTLIRKGWILRPTQAELEDAAELYKIVPLPFASIYREAPENDTARGNVPGILTSAVYNSITGKYENYPYPGTYIINYQVDYWCLKKYTEAHIYEWMMSELGKVGAAHNEVFIDVTHNEPWGTHIQGCKLSSFSDNTELEGVEDTRRYLRFTANFQLNALLFRPIISATKPIFIVNTAINNADNADSRYNLYGTPLQQTSNTAPISLFRDKVRTVPVQDLFKSFGNVTIERSLNTSDGRYDVFTRKMRNDEFDAFTLNFADSNAYAGNHPIMLAPGRQLYAIRFAYLADTVTNLKLYNGNDEVIQTWELPVNDKWTQFEVFSVATDDKSYIRFSALTAGTLVIDRANINMLNGFVGNIITPTSNVIVGADRIITFSGLNDQNGYIISSKLLNTTSVYDIVIENDVTAATIAETINVGNNAWLSFATLMQPKFGGNSLVLTLKAVIYDLLDPQVTLYKGASKGRFVRIKIGG